MPLLDRCLDRRSSEGRNPRNAAATDAGEWMPLPTSNVTRCHRTVLMLRRPCKAKKVKCGEEKPSCLNCQRQGEPCDYSIRLNWDGRTKRKAGSGTPEPSFVLHSFGPSGSPAATAVPLNFSTSTGPDSTATLNGVYESANRGELEPQSRRTGNPPKQHYGNLTPTHQKELPVSMGQYPTPTITPSATRETGTLPGSGPDDNILSFNNDSSSIPEATDHDRDKLESRSQADVSIAPIWGSVGYLSHMTDIESSRRTLTPENSSLESSGTNTKSVSDPAFILNPTSRATMLPPHHIPPQSSPTNTRKDRDDTLSPDNRRKRIKLSPMSGFGHSSGTGNTDSPDTSSFPQPQATQVQSVAPGPPSNPFNMHMESPLTPALSTAAPEDHHQHPSTEASPHVHYLSPDLRRLSVSSLLSGPAGDGSNTVAHAERFTNNSAYPVPEIGTDTVTYGLDRGFPDLDVSKNDDNNALNGMSPVMDNDDMNVMVHNRSGDDLYVPTEFGFGLQAKNMVFGKGGYYAKPVPVKIPRSLEPLPATLLQNPMNLLYFHHFLNHTARILVPHDCSENPFRKILPQSNTYRTT